MPDFAAIPILDYSLINRDSASRTHFLKQLQDALINVGFFYLSNHPISQKDIDLLIDYIPKLFGLSQDSKDKISKINSPHFLGYSRFGTELTKHVVDQREQFDFATRHVCRWKEGDPDYYRLWGPSQWPDENLIPGFSAHFEHYLDQVQDLSNAFSSLIAEALGLGSDGFAPFYDPPELMQHRSKIVGYPVVEDGASDQGVGPHFDGGFLTFVTYLNYRPRGLQVQNLSGKWIDVPPIPGTFVINIGKTLEFVTQGLARATSHRVLSPKGSTGPRYSVPFFHNISLDLRLADRVLEFPPEIRALRDRRGQVAASESADFHEFDREPSGKISLIGRVKSHPDVAARHYPDFFKEMFPNGHYGFGSAY